jgi:nitrite reductase/ring-hydroxylating ferredoxin subunit
MQRLCALEDLQPGRGKVISLAGTDGAPELVLVRTATAVCGFRNQCPHQGRSLDYAPDEFLFTPGGQLVCPHHGATFELPAGQCVSGPCLGASLAMVELEIREQAVWLSKA